MFKNTCYYARTLNRHFEAFKYVWFRNNVSKRYSVERDNLFLDALKCFYIRDERWIDTLKIVEVIIYVERENVQKLE